MKKFFLRFIWLFLFPIIITNLNLKTVYRINILNRKIKELERENVYIKKKIFEQTSLVEIQKKALAMGFDVAEPSTIIIIEKQTSKKLFANAGIIKTISHLIFETQKT
ncbi:MAG: hypothetical protein ACP5IO_01350 [Elusimicrobiales bacterium]